jgi:hypothetical protein
MASLAFTARIHDDLLDLSGICLNLPKRLARVECERNIFANQPSKEFAHFRDQCEMNRLPPGLRRPPGSVSDDDE